jgi:hypothetical protein
MEESDPIQLVADFYDIKYEDAIMYYSDEILVAKKLIKEGIIKINSVQCN